MAADSVADPERQLALLNSAQRWLRLATQIEPRTIDDRARESAGQSVA